MDEKTIAERLAQAGATQIGLGATIRPAVDPAVDPSAETRAKADISTDETMAASSPSPPRSLPRITVDLRGTLSPEGKGSPGADLEVRALLGEGGMGRVFLARQHSLERDVAVKTAKDGAPDAAKSALLLEGVITGQLEHPAIVPVHALGVDHAGRPAMVMKRVEGVSWDELLDDPAHAVWESWEGSPEDRLPGHLQILSQVCNAVHFAHSRGIVHRDLKPENVLIGHFGDVYVADWGVAARIDHHDSRLCGTPGFMAPEMAKGAPVDERTDVYLLGAVLHNLLTGRIRHDATTSVAAIALAITSEPFHYDESLPAELGALANRACHVSPDERPESALAFRSALADYSRHRASVQLGEEAIERVERLEVLHAKDNDEEEQREIDRLVVEARFGLEQALEGWGDNAAANDALARLEVILEERRARAAKLEKLARDLDPTIGEKQRNSALSMLAVFGVVMGVFAWWKRDLPSPQELVFFGAVVTGALILITLLFGRKVMRNAFGRQTLALLYLAAALLMIMRVTGLFVEIDPVHALFRDSFVFAAITGMGAISLLRWVWPIVLIFIAGGLLLMAYPALALPIFGTSTAAAIVAGALLARLARAEL